MASYFDFAGGLGTEIVTIHVGPKRVPFMVHKNLLVNQSHYFRGALTGTLFKEATEGVITFEDEDPDSFRILLGFLYQNNIPRIQPYMAKPDFSKYKPKRGHNLKEPPVPLSSKTQIAFTGVLLDDPDPPTDPAAPVRQVHCMHLSGHVPFKDFSPEEIRLSDYENAMEHVVDPLRRDAGIFRKVNQEEASKKKKSMAPNRRAWLNGMSPRPGQTVNRQGVIVPVPSPVKAEEATAGGMGFTDKPVTPPAAVDDSTLSFSPTSQSRSAVLVSPVPPSIQSQPKFTFRPPKPTAKQEADLAQPAAAPRKMTTHLSYAAVAAMGQQQKTGMTYRSIGGGVRVSNGSILHARDKKRAKNTDQAAAMSPTPETWASRILASTTQQQSALPESNDTVSVSAESDRDMTEWPFKTNPEADTLQTTDWLTWKGSVKDLNFRCREEAFEKNEQYQVALLRLAIMAEKFCWDRLFNAALDAYLDGEVIMNRRHVPLEHINLAYSSCYPTSPLRRFFSDMVHFEVKTCLTHSRYLDLAQEHEDFLGDLFRRLDYETWIPGKSPFCTLRNPLRVRRCQYHHHSNWQNDCLF